MRGRVVVIFLLVLGWATGSLAREARADGPPVTADAEGRERSRAMFRRGVAQLRAQEWGAARASFEAAWGLYPHPSILLNLGIARLRTDDPVRAEQDLVRFLSEDVGASQDELAGAREALAEARGRLGTLRVVASPASARVAVDGNPVETVRRPDPGTSGVVAELRMKPGRHRIEVEADGHVTEKRDVELAAKGESVVSIGLSVAASVVSRKGGAAARGPAPRVIVGWSLAGFAGAALITSGITALRAKSLADGYNDPSSARYQDPDARSEGITFRTSADVLLGVAVASGVTAAILLFTDLGKGAPDVARRGALLRW
jgi:hypothetical protein